MASMASPRAMFAAASSLSKLGMGDNLPLSRRLRLQRF
jgi:hypothetical protein